MSPSCEILGHGLWPKRQEFDHRRNSNVQKFVLRTYVLYEILYQMTVSVESKS